MYFCITFVKYTKNTVSSIRQIIENTSDSWDFKNLAQNRETLIEKIQELFGVVSFLYYLCTLKAAKFLLW